LHRVAQIILFFYRAEAIKQQKKGSKAVKHITPSAPPLPDISKMRIASVKQNEPKAKRGGLTKQEIEVLRYLRSHF